MNKQGGLDKNLKMSLYVALKQLSGRLNTEAVDR